MLIAFPIFFLQLLLQFHFCLIIIFLFYKCLNLLEILRSNSNNFQLKTCDVLILLTHCADIQYWASCLLTCKWVVEDLPTISGLMLAFQSLSHSSVNWWHFSQIHSGAVLWGNFLTALFFPLWDLHCLTNGLWFHILFSIIKGNWSGLWRFINYCHMYDIMQREFSQKCTALFNQAFLMKWRWVQFYDCSITVITLKLIILLSDVM